MTDRRVGVAPVHHHGPQPVEHDRAGFLRHPKLHLAFPFANGLLVAAGLEFHAGLGLDVDLLLHASLRLYGAFARDLSLGGLRHRQAAASTKRTGCPDRSNASLTWAIVNVPKWNTLAASNPVAPASAPSTKCWSVPTPPEAITG